MSLIRDAHYDAKAARICRQDGHRITGDRCGMCRIRRLEDAYSNPEPRQGGGFPVSYLETRPSAPKQPRLLDACGKGHVGNWWIRPDGQRHCRDCRNARQRRFKARRRAVQLCGERAAA
jgi:hypothetical protein